MLSLLCLLGRRLVSLNPTPRLVLHPRQLDGPERKFIIIVILLSILCDIIRISVYCSPISISGGKISNSRYIKPASFQTTPVFTRSSSQVLLCKCPNPNAMQNAAQIALEMWETQSICAISNSCDSKGGN